MSYTQDDVIHLQRIVANSEKALEQLERAGNTLARLDVDTMRVAAAVTDYATARTALKSVISLLTLERNRIQELVIPRTRTGEGEQVDPWQS